MAYSPATSVANQIRNRALGVNAGGASGRPKPLHMGTTGSQRGGLNTRGSNPGPRLTPGGVGVVPTGTPAPNARPAATPRPTSGYVWVVKNGQKVRVHRSTLTPDVLRRALAMPMNRPAPAARPVAAAPAAPVVPTDPLDYRSQAGYIRDMAGLNDALSGDRRDIARQLEENKREYGRAIADGQDRFRDNVTQTSASQAARGIISSGMREDANADRFKEFDGYMKQVEEQLGTGASQRLNEALAEIERREAFEREGIEGQYREEWSALHPASPIVEQPAAAAPAAPVTPAARPHGPGNPPPNASKGQVIGGRLILGTVVRNGRAIPFVNNPARPGTTMAHPWYV